VGRSIDLPMKYGNCWAQLMDWVTIPH